MTVSHETAVFLVRLSPVGVLPGKRQENGVTHFQDFGDEKIVLTRDLRMGRFLRYFRMT